MKNVGETPRFEIPSGPGTLAYVWKWWDDTVDVVTGTNRVYKTLNIGGNPADSFLVRFACEVVDDVGQSSEALGSLVVNNPPYIPGTNPPSIAVNDEVFPFATQFNIITCDFEENGIDFVRWFDNTAHLGTGVVATPVMHPVAGTYAGNLVGYFTPYRLSLDYTVRQDGTVSAFIIDGDAGTTKVDFLVRGYTPDDPFVSTVVQPTSLIVDASNLPRQVISPTAVVELGAYSNISAVQPVFTWSFQAADGWAVPEQVSYIQPVQQANGAWAGTYSKSVSSETAGDKTVELTISIDGATSTARIPVTLVDNEIPDNLDVRISIGNTEIGTDYTVADGDKLNFFVSATDPNNEITYAVWTLTLGATTEYLVGNKVYVDTTGLTGESITGIVTVYDIHDSPATLAIPTVFVN